MLRCIKAVISGRVQGVGYRAAAQRRAQALGLNGWVRSLADGQVELLADGDAESLAQLLEWCQHGPLFARVKKVVVEELKPRGDHVQFSIRTDDEPS